MARHGRSHIESTDDLLGTLRTTSERLGELAAASTQRVLAGAADRPAMETVYAAIRGDVPVETGLAALRRSLGADGVDPAAVDGIEALFLNAALRV